MASNVIGQQDGQGKYSFKNLDNAFGGKTTTLLEMEEGKVKSGVLLEQPYLEVSIPAAATTFTLSGSAGVVFLTAANTADCLVDISGLATPAGSMVTVHILDGGGTGDINFKGKGVDDSVPYDIGTYWFFFGKPDGTLIIK